ncbi:MAG TPA: alpha/beta fold hydrolase [Solirubrobacteraceae bacterium]|nr:alpha/beta fold hydrolase [Solirubrobacteraceae bacterium]
MSEPLMLIPGLQCTARLFAPQLPALWLRGPVTIADHTRDDSMAAIAGRILATAPPRFALAGLSMGGYISFEILRQAPERVARLALLDTSARPDTAAQTERRRAQMELARAGRLDEVVEQQWPLLVHPDHLDDEALRATVEVMAEETGVEAFVREQTAIIGRPDSRGDLGAIRCPTLVLVGDRDALTPPEFAHEMAAGIEGARLVTVADAGHVTTHERPEQVTGALLQWLRD